MDEFLLDMQKHFIESTPLRFNEFLEQNKLQKSNEVLFTFEKLIDDLKKESQSVQLNNFYDALNFSLERAQFFGDKFTDFKDAIVFALNKYMLSLNESFNVSGAKDSVELLEQFKLNLLESFEKQKVENTAEANDKQLQSEKDEDTIDGFDIQSIQKKNTTRNQYLISEIQEREFAIPIECIVEVVKDKKLTQFPDERENLEGLINLRGEPIPIINLPKIWNENQELKQEDYFLICSYSRMKFGIRVKKADQVSWLDSNHFTSAALVVGLSNRDMIENVIIQDKKTILIFNLNKLVAA